MVDNPRQEALTSTASGGATTGDQGPDDCGVLCGPTPLSHGPGTERFDGLIRSIASAATRVGAASNYGYFFWTHKPAGVVRAAEKIEAAHRLLLGAHALLLDVRDDAKRTGD